MYTLKFEGKELQAILWAIEANKLECDGVKADFMYGQTEMDIEAKIVDKMAAGPDAFELSN